jgi:hypothetical protein
MAKPQVTECPLVSSMRWLKATKENKLAMPGAPGLAAFARPGISRKWLIPLRLRATNS